MKKAKHAFPHAKLKNVKLTNTLARNVTGGLDKTQYNDRLAERYARWLAKRDRIEIDAELESQSEWDGFIDSAGRWTRRIRRVAFGKRSRSGRYSYREIFEAKVTIDIPHWDHDPVVTEVESMAEAA